MDHFAPQLNVADVEYHISTVVGARHDLPFIFVIYYSIIFKLVPPYMAFSEQSLNPRGIGQLNDGFGECQVLIDAEVCLIIEEYE